MGQGSAHYICVMGGIYAPFVFWFIWRRNMIERMTRSTGVRLTPSQAAKLERLACDLRTSKNRLMGLLIDTAAVETLPSVSVGLEKNNRTDVALSGQNVNAVGA